MFAESEAPLAVTVSCGVSAMLLKPLFRFTGRVRLKA
jgi:hypothetical protein